MNDWPQFRRVVLILLAGMIVAFGGLTFWGQFQRDLDFHGLSMKREDLPGHTAYRAVSIGHNEKTAVSVICAPEGDGMRVEFAAGTAAVQAYHVADGQAERLTPEVKREDGQDYWQSGEDYWQSFEFTAGEAVYFAGLPEPDRVRASWSEYLYATVFVLIVMLYTAFPLALFKLRYMFQVEDPEPTKLFWFGRHLSTVLLAFVAFVMYCVAVSGG